MRRACIAVAVIALGLLPAAPMADLAVSGRGPQSPQFRATSDLVQVYATVTGRGGAGVHDLRGDEFELFVDGKRQEIAVFSALVQPLSVAIVLDHSGSTNAEFAQVLQAAGAFIGRLFKEDRTRIDTLGWNCAPFTNDRATLVAALQKPLPRDPGSPIWSATDRAMSALLPEAGRRVVLLLSDGADNQEEMINQPGGGRSGPPAGRSSAPPAHGCVRADTSNLTLLRDVTNRAERESVMVYAVAVPETDPISGAGPGGASSAGDAWGPAGFAPRLLDRRAQADLAKLATRSGGSLQRLTNYSQLDAAFKVIADELHLQYLLGFVPSTFDGKRHEITVRVKRPGVSVRAREAFIASRR